MYKPNVFSTSRLADFATLQGLTTQTGFSPGDWPYVVLKETIDNLLDAAEDEGLAPRATITIEDHAIVVADEGPGIAPETVTRILDDDRQTSSRAAYIGPSRGMQGNALQCLIAMPYVLDGKRGETVIESRGVRHEIAFTIDPVRLTPVIEHIAQASTVTTGTRVTIRWPQSLAGKRPSLHSVAQRFLWLNPHLAITLDGKDIPASDEAWAKWRPNQPGSCHWYTPQTLHRLIAAHAGAYERLTVRDFILRRFDNLSSTVKVGAILDAAGVARMTVADLARGEDSRIAQLLTEMQAAAKPVNPTRLGVLGRDNVALCAKWYGATDLSRFRYLKQIFEIGGMPYVAEVAFAYAPDLAEHVVITGLNFSPTLSGNPFRDLAGVSLDTLLGEALVHADDPLIVFAHVTAPRLVFSDKGKSQLILPEEVGASIADMVIRATDKWTKQKRAEARNAAAEMRRSEIFLKRDKPMTLVEAVRFVEADDDGVPRTLMERAYLKASNGGRLPVMPRMLFYPARPELIRLTGQPRINADYFQQHLLIDYMEEHRVDWDIVWDDRGHFFEPHTGRTIGLGTLPVRDYVGAFAPPRIEMAVIAAPRVITSGPEGRYGGILYTEKEGFRLIMEEARIQERFDIGVVSAKGMSNTATRTLIDEVCGRLGRPLFILHDFDIAGFSIQHTVFNSNRRYIFRHKIANVIDFGLRLDDVERLDLASEPVEIRVKAGLSSWRIEEKRKRRLAAAEALLTKRGATPAEIEFLLSDDNGTRGKWMKRVELNAMTAQVFIDFVEGKLDQYGMGKVMPDVSTLAAAHAAFVRGKLASARFAQELTRVNAEPVDAPADLEALVRQHLETHRESTWEDALLSIVNG